MKKLMVFALVMVAIGVMLPIGAVPTVPPIPSPSPTPPPETPAPEPPPDDGGGGQPIMERQQKFEVISTEPVMEGYAGGSIDYSLKVLQKGYPELEVNLSAEVPEKWKATFSKNDFDLSAEESMELQFSLAVPESVPAESHQVRIIAVGKAKEDTLEVKDSVTVTAMTYLVDIGVVNLQIAPPQPQIGETVTVTATAVNYTQREMSSVVVEFMVNNALSSRQTVALPGGVSQPVTFGWTAQSGTFTLLVRTQAAGDTNRGNNQVNLKITLGGGAEQADALYQQAVTLYSQENYSQAADLLSSAVIQYTNAGETSKALEASRLQDLCNSYIQANRLMSQGEQAFQAEDYVQAAQNFEQARDAYAQIGDVEKQGYAQQRLDEAVEAQESGLNLMYIGISAVGVAVVILAAMLISRRRRRPRPMEQPPSSSRFRLEEPSTKAAPSPVSKPISTSTEAAAPREPVPREKESPAELVRFHEKTEDALSRFTKGYIRDNLQQAMRAYLSLEGEKKQLPRGRDLELERIINTNLKELEHRIFGTF